VDPLLAALRLLAILTGGLQPTAAAPAAQLESLRRLIARCVMLGQQEPFLAPTDLAQLVDMADVEEAEFSALRRICEEVQAELQAQPSQTLRTRVFRREVPVTAEVPEASPAWAGGAAVSKNYGPFTTQDNRPIWFSTVDTPAYVSLIGPTGADPLLLLPSVNVLTAATQIEFSSGSVWIAARLLSPEAPSEGYCGLRVKRALLRLDALPVTAPGALTVATGTGFAVDFELDHPQHAVQPEESALHPGRTATTLPSFFRLVVATTATWIEDVADAEASVFGSNIALRFDAGASPRYDERLERVLVPLLPDAPELAAEVSSNGFHLDGRGDVRDAAWALHVARPALPGLGEASGAGEIALVLSSRLNARWSSLTANVRLSEATLLLGPAGSTLSAKAANNFGGGQRFGLWRHVASSRARCSLELTYGREIPLLYRIEADRSEVVAVEGRCHARLDRPIATDGQRFHIAHADCHAFLFFSPTAGAGLLVRHIASLTGISFRPLRLCFALRNAVVRADTVQALVLGGSMDPAMEQLSQGSVSLFFGVSSILPILPDPYAANVEVTDGPSEASAGGQLWSRIRWGESEAPDLRLRLISLGQDPAVLCGLLTAPKPPRPPQARPSRRPETLVEDRQRESLLRTTFDRALDSVGETLLLLDVSSHADQLGVGLGFRSEGIPPSQALIRDLDLVSLARDVRVITPPQVQWEPVWTIQNPSLAQFPSPLVSADDGGASMLGIDTVNLVPVDPSRVLRSLVAEHARRDPGTTAAALFTLPFGIKAVAAPLRYPPPTEPSVASAELALVQPESAERGLAGGLQVSLKAIDPLSTPERESPRFPGGAIQLRNGIDPATGAHLGLSVLSDNGGNAVESIFNAEFAPGTASGRVPLTRIDLSGYGASTYSRWSSPAAGIAKTSQVRFDVPVGRTAHEVVQVRSILYPWAVQVVRTVTIERTPGGGVFRRDSGWAAVSDGVFDFPSHQNGSVIETHPGIVKGAFNVRRIRDTTHVYERGAVRLAAVRFDADIRIADVVVGGSGGLVTSVDQVGFVQLAPSSNPLTPEDYAALLAADGPLGGPVDCVVDIGRSGQRMRLTRVDVAAAPRPAGTPAFAASARGSLSLPRDGQWSVARQPVNPTADCLPADPHHGVPLVRKGPRSLSDAANSEPYLFAEPADLLAAGTSGFHVALLWSTGTQRVLFPRPQIPKNQPNIRGAVLPLLADVFATSATLAVFPPTLLCLKVPFPDYALEILGEGRLRLALPSSTFPAERVSGDPRRELSNSTPIRTFADYAATRFALTLDSSLPQPWSFKQEGVAIVQEREGVVAMTSHGTFRASSEETIRWTLVREDFGAAFAEPKALFPLLSNGVTSGSGLPSGGATVPLSTTEKPEGPNPKIGLRWEFEIPEGVPTFIGHTTGGHIEIITDFQRHFSLEVVVGIAVAVVFPAGALLKVEFEALRRHVLPGNDNTVEVGPKSELTLAIGVYVENHYPVPFPFPLQFNWEVFLGIGFAIEGQPGTTSIGIGIIFQAAGSVQYPHGFALVEVGVKVEGQGLIAFENDDTFIVCKGSLAIEITVAFILDIEWEIVEGEICKQAI
jgi:hypothetical protein